MSRRPVPFGSWPSPITADDVAQAGRRFSDLRHHGGSLYWTETRPDEGGRTALVRRGADGRIEDASPPGCNVRTRVHEYGGAAYAVDAGRVFFCHFDDQKLYLLDCQGQVSALTAAPGHRYADLVADRARNRVICVREQHGADGAVVNSVAAVDAATGTETTLCSGHDFYAFPRLSPDGSRLAWMCWDHPRMPWDGTRLMIATLNSEGGVLAESVRCIAGGAYESVLQPTWTGDENLCFVSDRSEWWNLYVFKGDEVQPVCPMQAEIGRPLWRLGTAVYALADPDTAVCSVNRNGIWEVGLIKISAGTYEVLTTEYTEIEDLCVYGETVCLVAGRPTRPPAIVELDLNTGQAVEVRSAGGRVPDRAWVSVPETLTFPTGEDATAHAFFYAPVNPETTAPVGARPPLIVRSHGGPTAAASAALSIAIQYWTSRGFAVVDVNYRGSTGFGRSYRRALYGQWGVADREDCEQAARTLAAEDRVDAGRLIIRGGSAGGYCTLCAVTFGDTFRAGASYYGVSDLEALARDTHKFESRYLDTLLGPARSHGELYSQRSPVRHVDKLNCPLLFLQGMEDKIVPPDQSKLMYEALIKKGWPTAYLAFPGEQHGFRDRDHIVRALEAELCFYGAAFGFAVMGPQRALDIVNLDSEWFEVVNDCNETVGLALRAVCHGNPELIHKTAHVAVFSPDGRLLLQKRSAEKDIQPGKWDTAVGGHVAVGETYLEAARRETLEELGLRDCPELTFLFDARIRNEVESENVQVFRAESNGPFAPPPDEITELRFWSGAGCRRAIGEGVFTPNLEAELTRMFDLGIL